MSRRGGRNIGRLAGGVAIGALAAATGLAQVDPPGGIDLGFSVDEQIIVSDNAALDPNPQGSTIRADTALSFQLSSETRLDTLVLTGSTVYRYADGPGISENAFADPLFSLSYNRRGANSAVSVDVSYRNSDIAFLRPLTDFDDDELPEDIDDLRGTGRRIDLDGSASLALGQQGPVGATLTLGTSETDYVDVSSSSLVDVSRRQADLDLRFALTPTIDATADLGYSEIDPVGTERFETTSLDLGVALQQQAGSYSVTLGYADTDTGERLSALIGRQITLPRGAISATLGATRDPAGETALAGSLTVQRTLKNGALSLSVDRTSRTTDSGERLVTSLSASYGRPLTTRTTLSVDASYALSEDTAADTQTEAADVGASVGYQLTQDWSLNLGYNYRSQSSTSEPAAEENSVSLGLARSFSVRVR